LNPNPATEAVALEFLIFLRLREHWPPLGRIGET
jgi:hypothetical protein